jgi:hypothetical protein
LPGDAGGRNPDPARPVAVRRLVQQAGPSAVEVLLYAHDANQRVRRPRWTPGGGVEVTEFGGH